MFTDRLAGLSVNIYDNSDRLVEKFTILQQKIYAGISSNSSGKNLWISRDIA
jgi:hypothetical protein